MKMAPLIGLVVKLPSNVLCIVTLYTFVSSTNLETSDHIFISSRGCLRLQSTYFTLTSTIYHNNARYIPNNLIRKQFPIVLWRKIRLSRFWWVQLQGLTDTFSKYIQSRVGFHDFSHGLLNKWLTSWEPIAISAEKQNHILKSNSINLLQVKKINDT